jgi:uncharacterized membrane protein
LSISQFCVKYREVILFNKNIIIAAVASIIADVVVLHYSAEDSTADKKTCYEHTQKGKITTAPNSIR